MDLQTASRDELIALIGQQQGVIAEQQALIAQQQAVIAASQAALGDLQRRVTALEERLTGRGGSGMPGNKPASTKPIAPPKPRKKRPHGYGRPRMTPTQTIDHAVDVCPDCGTRLSGGWLQRTREVIEIPPSPVAVIAHQYIARICPLCRRRHVPVVTLEGAVLGQRHRLGVRLVSLIVTLREEGRLPIATIQWYLATVCGLRLSAGAIVAVLAQVAARASPVVAGIAQTIQQSPVVCADETGWREHGANGFVWTFSTPTERYFIRRNRTKGVVDEVLGPDGGQALVSDFYAGYHHYLGVHQRCWAHLLRDIHDLLMIYPSDTGLAEWAAAVRAVYDEANAFVGAAEKERRTKQRELEQRLLAISQPFVADPLAVQAKLCRRIVRHLTELFVFVHDPRVPATNNAAERSLRHLVTSRKISGGTQSPTGTASKMILASLLGTWRARGLNPFEQCQLFLQSPHQ